MAPKVRVLVQVARSGRERGTAWRAEFPSAILLQLFRLSIFKQTTSEISEIKGLEEKYQNTDVDIILFIGSISHLLLLAEKRCSISGISILNSIVTPTGTPRALPNQSSSEVL